MNTKSLQELNDANKIIERQANEIKELKLIQMEQE